LGVLEDLERNTFGQSMSAVITDSATGRRVLALHTMPAGQPDAAPFDRNYPAGQTPIGTESDVLARTKAVISRLDGAQDGFGPVMVGYDITTKQAGLYEVPGIPIGPSTGEPFTVSHGGGDVWHVTGGVVTYGAFGGQSAFAVEPATLHVQEGWIGFQVTYAPRPSGGHIYYTATPSAIYSPGASYVNAASPTINYPDETTEKVDHMPGSLFYPLAYVTAPTNTQRAEILIVAGGVDLSLGGWVNYGPLNAI
jgi:hypothetical protein